MLMLAFMCNVTRLGAEEAALAASRAIGKVIAIHKEDEIHHLLVHPTVFRRYEDAIPEIKKVSDALGSVGHLRRDSVRVMIDEREGFVTRDAYIVKLERQNIDRASFIQKYGSNM